MDRKRRGKEMKTSSFAGWVVITSAPPTLRALGFNVKNALSMLLAIALVALSILQPAQARYLSPDSWDPFLPGVDINRYAYGQNDPINNSDPNGHYVDQMGNWNGDQFDGLNGFHFSPLEHPYVTAGMALSIAGPIAYSVAITSPAAVAAMTATTEIAAGEVGIVAPTAAAVGLTSKLLKNVPNPFGKLGDPTTRARVAEIVSEIEARGNIAKTEFKVTIQNGQKRIRFADVAEIDRKTGSVIKYHQVGETTKRGMPVSRERKAASDITTSTGKQVQFHEKNKGGVGDGFKKKENTGGGLLEKLLGK
jgi:hypothetical protein